MLLGIILQVGSGVDIALTGGGYGAGEAWYGGGALIGVGIGLLAAGVPITVAARVPPPPTLVLAVEPDLAGGALLLRGRW